ncbi:MAG: ABC-type transport auxiliary lipoprotein family protein [Burkholderiales bacterium]
MTQSSSTHTSRAAVCATSFRHCGLAGLVGLLGLFGGCTASLLPKPPQQPALYALNDTAPAKLVAPAQRAAAAVSKPTLLVNPPRAAAGFDTRHIVYLRQANQIEYFADSQWVDTPAQMLAPLIARAIERSGAFNAVLLAPTAAAGEMRLDTEVIRLQQDFGMAPSQVRFTLRAVLLDSRTRRVIAVREFDASVPAATEDATGGVAAANLAVQRVLDELAGFAAKAAEAP